MKTRIFISITAILLAISLGIQPLKSGASVLAASSVYYVAPDGIDSNPGSEELPWRTITKAANTLVAGDTVIVNEGTYYEQVLPRNSGSPGNWIKYKANPGDRVIIDGTGITGLNTTSGIVYINGQSYIEFDGFEVRNADGGNGVATYNETHYLTFRNMKVHDVDTSGFHIMQSWDPVIGRVTNIVIDSCEVYNTNSNAQQEAVSLVGVTYFEVKNTIVHDVLGAPQKEGIDAKGGCSNGTIHDNEVYNSKVGIYLDAHDETQHHIEVYNNVLHDNNYGIALGSEGTHQPLEDIDIYNNLIYQNADRGISVFEYQSEKTRVNIVNNTLYHNGLKEIAIYEGAAYFNDCVIANNIIYGTDDFLVYFPDAPDNEVVIDYNLFYASFYNEDNVYGTNYITADPKFVNPSAPDFRLMEDSPAKDAGSSVSAPGYDFKGHTRPQGVGYDIGAYEYYVCQPPVLDDIGDKSINEGQLLEFIVSATDPNCDRLTYSADLTSLPPEASFDPATRTFSWTPSYTQAGTYTDVKFQVSDGSLIDFENITITVSNVNRPPVLDSPGNRIVKEEALLEFIVSAIDPDGDPLTYSANLTSLPPEASFDLATQTFSWTPVIGQAGTYPNVHFEVSDGELTDSEYITITVMVNVPPAFNSIGDKSINEGQPLEFTVSATDPNNDPLTYSADLTSLPPEASFDPATQTFSWTPAIGQAGTYTDIHFEVSDGELIDSENITVTVTVNNPPAFNSIDDKSVNEGQLLEFTVSATDPDGDPLTYSADLTPLPPEASFDPATRTFSWTPSYTQAGTYTDVNFKVSDGSLIDSGNITITVSNVNRPPILDSTGNRTVNEGQLLEFTVSATDPDGDPLTYSADLTSLLPEASFDPATQTFSWTPSIGQAGTYNDVNFEVSDGELTDSEDITITVNANDPQPPTQSTGGGGGGGGGGVASLVGAVNPEGRLARDIRVASQDTRVSLDLTRNTICNSVGGSPLSWISIRALSETEQKPDILENSVIISEYYRLDPPGANFDPSIKLSFKYKPSLLPEWADIDNLYIGCWDENKKKWEKLESHIDTEKNIIWTEITHFSTYVIIAEPRHPEFELSELNVTPSEIEFGEQVSVSVLVTNVGDSTGLHEVILEKNGRVEDIRKVTLDGGVSETVTFNFISNSSGDIIINIGTLSATLKVNDRTNEPPLITQPEPSDSPEITPEPAKFTISQFDVIPSEVIPSKQITISALIENVGGSEGAYVAVLKINELVEDKKYITLGIGESEIVVFNIAKDREGDYTINIGDKTGQFSVVVPPPPISIPTEALQPTVQSPTNWWLISSITGSCVVLFILLVSLLVVRK